MHGRPEGDQLSILVLMERPRLYSYFKADISMQREELVFPTQGFSCCYKVFFFPGLPYVEVQAIMEGSERTPVPNCESKAEFCTHEPSNCI